MNTTFLSPREKRHSCVPDKMMPQTSVRSVQFYVPLKESDL